MSRAPGLEPPPAGPAGLGELFMAFTELALQGFGGVLPWVHRTLVERRGWLTRDEFVDLLGLAQLLPGPNVINLAVMAGDRWFGWRGSLAAVAGMMAAPTALVLGVALVYERFAHLAAVRGALGGMAAVAAGLVIATGVKLGAPLRRNARALAFAAAAFAAVALARWPLAWVVAVLAPAAVGAAWRMRR